MTQNKNKAQNTRNPGKTKISKGIKSRKIESHYDEEYDIFAMNWGGKVEHSVELFNGSLILDVNKNEDIVGLEIFDFQAQLNQHEARMKKLFGDKNE